MNSAELAALLLEARDGELLAAGPAPATEAEAYEVQALTMPKLGDIGGWKVGAPGPDAPPSCAPMPASGLFPAPHEFDSSIFRQREVESEICFILGRDLRRRIEPYITDDILAAIATCHPAIEILQSRYASPVEAGPLAGLADLIQHGAFIWGDAVENWQEIDFTQLAITQTIEGGETKTSTGNPAGDMIRLIVWLANVGANWAGGLKAGQVITCGSWTGKTPAPAGSTVTTQFTGLPPVVARFSA